MNYTDQAIAKLREQQSKVKERSAPWMVAEQLTDLCRREPASAELIVQDLENEAMSIVEAEKQIKALADKNRKKGENFSCVTPTEAEEVLRKFYGLPDPGREPEPQPSNLLSLADFMR